MLEKWEKAVMRINNNGQVWKVNRFRFICSNHFEQQDYIVPPTSTKGTRTCRLKKYAVPSVFSMLDVPNCSSSLTDEDRQRLGLPRKHSLPQEESDNMSPAAKVFCDHNYARKLPVNHMKGSQEDLTKEGQQEEPEEELDRPELEQKLRQKIKNLQQKLRRSKKKLQSMEHFISHLQDELIILTK